jgi:hypothetical protein
VLVPLIEQVGHRAHLTPERTRFDSVMNVRSAPSASRFVAARTVRDSCTLRPASSTPP